MAADRQRLGFFKLGMLAIVCLAFVFGAISLASVDGVVQTTNTNEFCITCHEMAAFAYEEYKNTTHFKNVSGVRAGCADCHVPREWPAKMFKKVRAVKDIYFHWLGTIDTPEKYETHRARMAETVWQDMKKADSRECRACHTLDAMMLDEQLGRASRMHAQMREKGETCIDCHKGLAHRLPVETDFSVSFMDSDNQ